MQEFDLKAPKAFMVQQHNDKFDKLTLFLGFIIGYLLFAGYLFLYQIKSIGRFDQDDFDWRLITPLVFQAGHWTDAACYLLIALSVLGIAKLRNQL